MKFFSVFEALQKSSRPETVWRSAPHKIPPGDWYCYEADHDVVGNHCACRLNAMELVHEDLQCSAGRNCWPRRAGDAVPRGIKRPAAALILSSLLVDAPRSPTEPLQAIQSSSKVFTSFRICSRLFETSSMLKEARSRSKLFEAIRGRSKLIDCLLYTSPSPRD